VADILPLGASITKVNGHAVSTLEEFRKHFEPEKGAHVWTVETDMGKVAALMFNQSLAAQVQKANTMNAAYLLTPGVISAARKMGFVKEERSSAASKLDAASKTKKAGKKQGKKKKAAKIPKTKEQKKKEAEEAEKERVRLMQEKIAKRREENKEKAKEEEKRLAEKREKKAQEAEAALEQVAEAKAGRGDLMRAASECAKKEAELKTAMVAVAKRSCSLRSCWASQVPLSSASRLARRESLRPSGLRHQLSACQPASSPRCGSH